MGSYILMKIDCAIVTSQLIAYMGTTDVYSFSDETYMSSEAKRSGTGQYYIRSTPRSPSTGPPSTPSTEAHSDTTYSCTQASFSSSATTTIPTYVTEYLTEADSVLSRDCDEDTQSLIQSVSHGRPFPTWCKSMPLVRRGLTSCFFLCCGVISKLTLLLVLAAPVKRKGARGEVRFPRRPRYYVPCSI